MIVAVLLLTVSCANNNKKNNKETVSEKEEKPTEPDNIIVTTKNFVEAETDHYFSDLMKEVPVNTFNHHREYSDIKTQVVIRENQDCLYSHAVVDCSEGATLINPEWDKYSVIQVFDENQYTFAVLYPGDSLHITSDMLTKGNYVWLNTRTEVRPENEAGYTDAHKHQDAYIIKAKSNKPYTPKGFDKASLDRVRDSLLYQGPKVRSWKAFGTPDVVSQEDYTIAAAGGWAGLPKEHAIYWPKIMPEGEAKKSSVCSKITLPKPPLQYDKGGFMSVTVYDMRGWIATENYALRDRNAEKDTDGSITFYFNCPDQKNNLDTVDNWTMVIRLYVPDTPEQVIDYVHNLDKNNVKIEVVQ
ncbi:DUF1254 domain-containing protein [Galbibacter pacificus]|uniref:DUF1254 domain-containing protein n=1 Tax=Galbibacter pacificus TaxID=2996052 RepID=A0ABT6FWH7_9FLAO|nr:DUF1254 domain-containing protein [Galbibacter pacificus]MDG3583934.1 DUF1254 domain-containing protein [Galbibacter pacificus]MDG3587628.1 DUF1254 domain-containing protein [Galbibacter pacificus]